MESDEILFKNAKKNFFYVNLFSCIKKNIEFEFKV